MPRLIEPAIELYDAWREARLDWGPGVHEDGFGLGPGDETATPEQFEAWVGRVRAEPGQRWWILEDGAVAGGIGPALRGRSGGRSRAAQTRGSVITTFGVEAAARVLAQACP